MPLPQAGRQQRKAKIEYPSKGLFFGIGGESSEKEADCSIGISGGDRRGCGRLPASEPVKAVGRKTSRRKERCCGTVPRYSGGQCPPHFAGSYGRKPEVPKQNEGISIGAAFGEQVPGRGAG